MSADRGNTPDTSGGQTQGAPSASVQVVEGLTSGVIAVDAQGRVVSSNPAACLHLNIAPESLHEGAMLREIDGLAPFVAIMDEVATSTQPIARREAFVGKAIGARKEIGVSVSLLEGPEDFNGVIFLFTDMTERRKLERTAEVNRQLASVGELAAGMVHELRNPLTIISGRAQLMMRKAKEDEELRYALDSILAETTLLARSITQFLGFSKPFELEPTFCTAAEVIERTLELSQHRAEKKGVVLDSEVLGDSGPLYIDKERVAEAIANIVNNAIDAVDATGHVWLRAMREAAETVFEITDDGPGIQLEEGENLFSPFFTKKRDGTGLGLSIVQRIAAAQGGSVLYSNRSEGGARFEFVIPSPDGKIE